MTSIPRSLADIDAGWLSSALNTDVESVRVDQIAADSAFLGTVARVAVTANGDDKPTSMIVKLPPLDPGALAVGRMLNVWVREVSFYEQLSPMLPDTVKVPRLLHSELDDDGIHAAIVLEDLAPAAATDQLHGATPRAARAAVRSLAALHATWWDAPRSADMSWVPGIDRPGAGAGLQAAMTNSIDRFATRFGGVLDAETIGWTRTFIPQLAEWLDDLATRPMTICHADFHSGNILVDPSNPDIVTIVDWQTAMYSGGATDLSFFLCTSVDIDVRRTIEADMLDLYLATLAEHGVDRSLVTSVRDDYRASILWWMGMLANNLADIATPTEHSAQLFDALVTRLHTAARDHRVDELV